MAITPDSNQSFYREVDEELRREQLGTFWSRYGKWLLIALALLVVAGVALVIVRNMQAKESARQSEVLDKVITDLGEGREKTVAAPLAELASSKNLGYRVSALLTQADLALGRGEVVAAAAAFGRIAANDEFPKPYRDLALVRQTAAEFDTIAPALVISRLTPLARPGGPWHGSAGEMVGAAYLKQGNPRRAAPIFAAIARDETVPESIRSRTVQMAGTLGVDAMTDQPSNDTAAPGASGN